MNSHDLKELGIAGRLAIIQKCQEIGGVHIGGSFSSLDFLVCFYAILKSKLPTSKYEDYYEGKIPFGPELLMSKGHCYLAQLAALDVVFGQTKYLDKYFSVNSEFFGHPKRNPDNFHFPVSSGSLGQGIVFGNGLAFAEKLSETAGVIVSVIGDGELNEGAVFEGINFAAQHKLAHWVVLDNNDQISLGKTSDILNVGSIGQYCAEINCRFSNLDGHDYDVLLNVLNDTIFSSKNVFEGGVLELNTIKGKGVSFMEGVTKWHHRRFREGEFEAAIEELKRRKR